jgi:hypothetical protein
MSTVRADNFGNRAGTSQIPADTLLQGTAKSWLNMNGQGVIAVRDSFNVSSIVDVGTGLYGVNYATSLGNANYAPTGMADNAVTACVVIWNSFSLTPTTASSRFSSLSASAGAATDVDRLCVAIHGDAA